MDLSKSNMFEMLKTRMDYSSERQRLVSENIANLDTPGYKGKDLKPLDFKSTLRDATTMTPVMTSENHLQGRYEPEKFRARRERKPFESFISDNNVTLEDQMMRMSETKGAFDLATTLYKKNTGMLQTAIRKPQ